MQFLEQSRKLFTYLSEDPSFLLRVTASIYMHRDRICLAVKCQEMRDRRPGVQRNLTWERRSGILTEISLSNPEGKDGSSSWDSV